MPKKRKADSSFWQKTKTPKTFYLEIFLGKKGEILKHEEKEGGIFEIRRSAKQMNNTDVCAMMNGAIKELMRGIQIAAELINQHSRSQRYQHNEIPGERAGAAGDGGGLGRGCRHCKRQASS